MSADTAHTYLTAPDLSEDDIRGMAITAAFTELANLAERPAADRIGAEADPTIAGELALVNADRARAMGRLAQGVSGLFYAMSVTEIIHGAHRALGEYASLKAEVDSYRAAAEELNMRPGDKIDPYKAIEESRQREEALEATIQDLRAQLQSLSGMVFTAGLEMQGGRLVPMPSPEEKKIAAPIDILEEAIRDKFSLHKAQIDGIKMQVNVWRHGGTDDSPNIRVLITQYDMPRDMPHHIRWTWECSFRPGLADSVPVERDWAQQFIDRGHWAQAVAAFRRYAACWATMAAGLRPQE